MKKTILLISTVLLAAGLSSCSGTKEKDDSRLCHIKAQTAVFGAPQTKTQVGDLLGDELLINWTPGDQIGIVTSNSTVSCFTNQTAEESANGDFTGLLSGTPTRAFYPYVEGVTDLTAVPFYIPTDQVYTGPESIGQYDVRVATSVTDMSRSYGMHFTSLTCLLRFEVDLTGLSAYTETDESGDGTYPAPLGDKSSISFDEDEVICDVNLCLYGESGVLTCSEETAYFTVDMSSGNPFLYPSTQMDGITAPDVRVIPYNDNLNFPVAGSETTVFYAVVAPGATAGTEFEITLNSESGTHAHWLFMTASLAVNLEAGHYYTIPLKASSLNTLDTVICEEYEINEEEGGEDAEN